MIGVFASSKSSSFNGTCVSSCLFSSSSSLKTLCICLQNPKKFDYSDLSNIISGLITIIINNKDTMNYKKLEIIQPSCCNLINSDDDIFKSLIDIGIKSGLKFLRKEYINKIKLIQIEINLLSTKNENEIININHEIVNINQEIINIDKEIEITDFQIEKICLIAVRQNGNALRYVKNKTDNLV